MSKTQIKELYNGNVG